MFKITTLFNNRGTQLQKQHVIDNHLNTLPCSDIVISYLLTRRHINRLQYNKVKDGGIIHSYNNVQTNMEEDDVDQLMINNIIQSKNPCKELHSYLLTIPESKDYLKPLESSISSY